MVLFRLGWLTVLSSRNIVEQELNFFVRIPGDIWSRGSDDNGEDKYLKLLAGNVERVTHRVIQVVAFPFLAH